MTPERAPHQPLFYHLPAAARSAAHQAARYLLTSAAILLMTVIGSVMLTITSPPHLTEPLAISLAVGGTISAGSAAVIHQRTRHSLPVIRAMHHRAERSPTLLLTTLLLLLTGPALVLPLSTHVHDAALIALTLGAPTLLSITTLTWLRVLRGYQHIRPRPHQPAQHVPPQQPAP